MESFTTLLKTLEKISLREIFDIFAEDFGTFPENIADWVKKYLTEETRKDLEEMDLSRLKIKVFSSFQSIEKKKPLVPVKKREEIEEYKKQMENLNNEGAYLEKIYKQLEERTKTDKQALEMNLKKKEELSSQLEWWLK